MNGLTKILNQPSFQEFHGLMRNLSNKMELNHLMVGFNFNDEQVLSTKIYYAFYGKMISMEEYPLDVLHEKFLEILPIFSEEHISTKYSPGGGLTFTIKYDENLNESKGFYVRCQGDNAALINTAIKTYNQFELQPEDFDRGFGNYYMYKNGQCTKSQYIYLNNCKKIGTLNNIPFSKSKSIELSAIRTDIETEKKLIAIGDNSLVSDLFYESIPQELKSLRKENFFCPAVNINNTLRSIYYFSKFDLNDENNIFQ